MESLLTLSIGEFRAVDIALKLIVASIAMASGWLLISITAVSRRERIPLIVAGVALAAAAWFESGVWIAWREAFELAGTSYCVTGQLLAPEGRIIAWAIGVPALLFSFFLAKGAFETSSGKERKLTVAVLLLLLLTAPFSRILGLIFLVLAAFFVAYRIAANNPMRTPTRAALASLGVGIFLQPVLGSLLPRGGSLAGELVRGEILHSVVDLFSLVLPAVILVTGILNFSRGDTPARD